MSRRSSPAPFSSAPNPVLFYLALPLIILFGLIRLDRIDRDTSKRPRR